MITIEYRFDGDEMSDQEYNSQEDKEFVITKDMIIELLEKNIKIPHGMEICETNLYVK